MTDWPADRAEWQQERLQRYRALPGRCRACGFHERTQDHASDCPTQEGNR